MENDLWHAAKLTFKLSPFPNLKSPLFSGLHHGTVQRLARNRFFKLPLPQISTSGADSGLGSTNWIKDQEPTFWLCACGALWTCMHVVQKWLLFQYCVPTRGAPPSFDVSACTTCRGCQLLQQHITHCCTGWPCACPLTSTLCQDIEGRSGGFRPPHLRTSQRHLAASKKLWPPSILYLYFIRLIMTEERKEIHWGASPGRGHLSQFPSEFWVVTFWYAITKMACTPCITGRATVIGDHVIVHLAS